MRHDDPQDDPYPPPEIPTLDRMPPVVDYSSRGPGDFVLSGPIYPYNSGNNCGRGRVFLSAKHALKWAQGKYGAHRVALLKDSLEEDAIRWAVLVRYCP